MSRLEKCQYPGIGSLLPKRSHCIQQDAVLSGLPVSCMPGLLSCCLSCLALLPIPTIAHIPDAQSVKQMACMSAAGTQQGAFGHEHDCRHSLAPPPPPPLPFLFPPWLSMHTLKVGSLRARCHAGASKHQSRLPQPLQYLLGSLECRCLPAHRHQTVPHGQAHPGAFCAMQLPKTSKMIQDDASSKLWGLSDVDGKQSTKQKHEKINRNRARKAGPGVDSAWGCCP